MKKKSIEKITLRGPFHNHHDHGQEEVQVGYEDGEQQNKEHIFRKEVQLLFYPRLPSQCRGLSHNHEEGTKYLQDNMTLLEERWVSSGSHHTL